MDAAYSVKAMGYITNIISKLMPPLAKFMSQEDPFLKSTFDDFETVNPILRLGLDLVALIQLAGVLLYNRCDSQQLYWCWKVAN